MVTPSQEGYSRTKHDVGRIIRDQKLFAFEKKKLNGLACMEMAQREYHRHMKVEIICKKGIGNYHSMKKWQVSHGIFN